MPPKRPNLLQRVLAASASAPDVADSDPSSARRGGILKRLHADLAVADPPTPSSSSSSRNVRARVLQNEPDNSVEAIKKLPFNLCMRRDWAKGRLSSPKVLEYSRAAAGQGAASVVAGDKAASDKNAHRTLVAALGWPEQAPPITYIDIPMGKKRELRPHPIVCPSAVFARLTANYPSMFMERIRGSETASEVFWKGIEGHPIVTKHPDLKPSQFSTTIPLGLHGDGAPLSKHDSLFTIGWNSILGSGTTMQQRFVYTCIKKSDMCEGTLDALWKYLAWSFDVLLSGRTPDRNWLGRPLAGGGQVLAGGFRASCIQLRGDWEFYASVLGFARWNEIDNMCFVCKASASPDLPLSRYLWTDASPHAGWRSTIRSHESYLAELAARDEVPSLVWGIKGLRLEGVMLDVLHTIDQGVATHLVANIFVELCAAGHFGPNQAAQAVALHAAIHVWYKDQSREVRSSKIQGSLTFERLRSRNDWPKLKAKAAATRHIARFALKLAHDHNSGSLHDRRRVAVIELLCRFYEIIMGEGMFLSSAAKQELVLLGPVFFQTYVGLSREAVDSRKKAWKFTPKFHLFLHICEFQAITLMNPRFGWVYSDEDLQKHMGDIASSCSATNVASVAMYKWVILVFDT
jgi:hypothetical protein